MAMAEILRITSKHLLRTLQQGLAKTSAASLPLQYKIWCIDKGILRTGDVYVDAWPDFHYVAAMHTSAEFARPAENLDCDVATFYFCKYSSDQKRAAKRFFEALSNERGWSKNRDVYVDNAELQPMLDIVEVLMPHGRLQIHDANGRGWRLYTVVERDNIEKYRAILDDAMKTMPDELYLDKLSRKDVEYIAPTWNYAPPKMVHAYFGWLFETFPSVCIRRKSDSTPVAWVHTYSCGSLANGYADPEYRGTGLTRILYLTNALKQVEFSPIQQYFEIHPDNIGAEKSAKKVYIHDMKCAENKTVVLYFCNNEKAKL